MGISFRRGGTKEEMLFSTGNCDKPGYVLDKSSCLCVATEPGALECQLTDVNFVSGAAFFISYLEGRG